MQVELADLDAGVKIEALDRPLNDDEFYAFCMQNEKLRIERESTGKIIVMPPAGNETSYRNNDLNAQLMLWAKADKRGAAFDSNTVFFLPDGSALGPDAAWILRTRLAAFTREQREKFLPLCPDFVVELTSPSDRLPRIKKKMRAWIDNAAQLGWLIDADRRTVYIYRPGQEPEEVVDGSHPRRRRGPGRRIPPGPRHHLARLIAPTLLLFARLELPPAPLAGLCLILGCRRCWLRIRGR